VAPFNNVQTGRVIHNTLSYLSKITYIKWNGLFTVL